MSSRELPSNATVPASLKPKAIRRVALLSLFMAGLVIAAIVADDRSLRAVAIAFASILGFPLLLLSLIDLGRVLRAENGGNFRASRTTWLLSHLQAALGATCMAAAAYAIYHNVSVWRHGAADFHDAMLLLWILLGLGLLIYGFELIRTAFMPEQGEAPRDGT